MQQIVRELFNSINLVPVRRVNYRVHGYVCVLYSATNHSLECRRWSTDLTFFGAGGRLCISFAGRLMRLFSSSFNEHKLMKRRRRGTSTGSHVFPLELLPSRSATSGDPTGTAVRAWSVVARVHHHPQYIQLISLQTKLKRSRSTYFPELEKSTFMYSQNFGHSYDPFLNPNKISQQKTPELNDT